MNWKDVSDIAKKIDKLSADLNETKDYYDIHVSNLNEMARLKSEFSKLAESGDAPTPPVKSARVKTAKAVRGGREYYSPNGRVTKLQMKAMVVIRSYGKDGRTFRTSEIIAEGVRTDMAVSDYVVFCALRRMVATREATRVTWNTWKLNGQGKQ